MKGVKSVVVELGILPVFVRIAGAPVEQLVIQPVVHRQGSSGSKVVIGFIERSATSDLGSLAQHDAQ
jgi:hypothetical protein